MMRGNPLLLKEFRQRMRTRRAPLVIMSYFISMALLTFLLLYENVQGQLTLLLPARGEQVFVTLGLLQMAVVVFLTPAFAAGAVSGERERRTLSVLLTTPLSPFTILMGKVLSSSALLLLLVIVTLPLYSLVFLFGAAVPQELLGVFGFQLVTVVLVAAMSVCWSTLALRSGWSTVLSYATVTWMVVITGLFGYGLQYAATRFPIDYFLLNWGEILLRLNPLWIEAGLAGAVPGNFGQDMFWFLGFYGVITVILWIFSVGRLRPQAYAFSSRLRRGDEKDFE